MSFKVISTNHIGFVVEDLDGFINIMTNLLDYKQVDRGLRDVERQSKVTGHKNAHAEIVYLSGGDFLLEVICYKGTKDTRTYKPLPVDVGHWHLSINIEDIEAVRKEAAKYGMIEIGEKISVNAGPNKGNQILYMTSSDGIIFEFTQKNVEKEE